MKPSVVGGTAVRFGVATAILVIALPACTLTSTPPVPVESLQVLSEVYTIDRQYRSMQGPDGWVDITILPPESPELVWVTGYRADVVGPDGATPLPPDFMCHSNLSFDAEAHRKRFGWKKHTTNRLFTVSQGQAQLQLPEGFGIPLMSNESLTVHTQALNHNLADTTFQVRVRVTIEYVRHDALNQPLTPLYMKSANALVLLDGEDGYYGVAAPDREHHGEGAHLGMAASTRVITDPFGRKFSGHWMIPPGRQEHRTLVTKWMGLPGDATVHFIAVHLHPFARTLTLQDLTAGRTLFTSHATGFDDKIGLQRVTSFADPRGLRLDAEHEYELTSVYDNTSSLTQEAMAVMYLYLRDDEFSLRRVRQGG